jgi:hypothetical protein
MDRNLPIIPAILFLVILVGLLGFYAIQSAKLADLPIQQVVGDSNSKPWAVYETNLVGLESEQVLDFSGEGVFNHVGQLVALQDGGWLVNRGAQNNFLARAVRRSAESSNTLYQSTGSLLRCSQRLTICEPWGEVELQFERAFDGIELENGKLLLFNPAKRMVFLVSPSGVIEDRLKNREYWFGASQIAPRQFIATNTAADRLDVLRVTGNRLEVGKYKVNPKKLAGETIELFSLSKSFLLDGQLWLMAVKDNPLTGDKRLYRVDTTKTDFPVFKTGVEYQDIADFEYIDGEFIFTEYGKHEVKAYSLAGKRLSVLNSPALNRLEQESLDRRSSQRTLMWGVLAVGLLALIACGVWMMKKSSRVTEKQKKERAGIFGSNFNLCDPVEHQIDPSVTVKLELSAQGKKLKRILAISTVAIAVSGIMLVAMFYFMGLRSEEAESGLSDSGLAYSIVIFFICMSAYAAYLYMAATPKRLFVKNGKLHWYAKKGKIFTFDPNTLIYTKHMVADQNVTVMLNNYKYGVIYDLEQLEKYVIPILHQGRQTNEIGFYMYQLKHNLKRSLIHIGFSVSMIVITLLLKLGS